MLQFITSPEWFLINDAIFELISFVVVLLIALYSFKIYKFTESIRYKYFAISFAIIGIASIIKIITDMILHQHFFGSTNIFTPIITLVASQNIFFILSLIAFRYFFLLGLLGIYLVQNEISRKEISLIVLLSFLMLPVAVVTQYWFFVFHITAGLMLLLITIKTYTRAIEIKKKSAFITALAFFILLTSQIIFSLSHLHNTIYVIAESIHLIGFIVLLINYINLVRK